VIPERAIAAVAWQLGATALGGGGVAHTDVHAEAKSGVCGGDSPS
jgi:hypothetical protein